MKRVLFVYHVATIGGGSYCLLNLLKSIDRAKIEPFVLLRKNGPLTEELESLGIKCVFCDSLRTVPYNKNMLTVTAVSNFYSILTSFSRFRRIVSSLKIDAVYLNTMMLYPYLKVARSMSVQTYIHIREHWPEKEHRLQRSLAISHINKYADKIVAINEYSASMVGKRRQDVSIVHDWVDFSDRDDGQSLSQVLGEDADGLKVFLFTGGLQLIKGTLEVIRTFSECIPDSDARLLALGIPPEDAISSRGVKRLIKFIANAFGYQSYSQRVYGYINKDSRIVCVPGTYKIKRVIEQSYCMLSYFTIPHANLALAESIILGLPSVAACTSESLEYSDGGSLALLFDINDESGFQSKIRELNVGHSSIKSHILSGNYKIKQLFDKQRNAYIINSLLID